MSQDIEKALADETDQLVDTIVESGIDGIIGGFPCQDLSVAGDGAGLSGTRSGLVWKMVKTIRLVRPKYVLLENVAALLNRGMGQVLGALACIGYDTEWDCVSASLAGAPHHRARIYILAHDMRTGGDGCWPGPIHRQPEFSWCENVRRFADMRDRPDIPEPLIRRISNGARNRLHGIGNGNPPCVIRELTMGLK